MSTIKIAIFASGRGSNALALIEKAKEFSNIEIAALMSDKPGAFALKLAEENNIPAYCFSFSKEIIDQSERKSQQEKRVLEKLRELKIDWIFLAGYMRLLSKNFIDSFGTQILNIHPSLLPKYPGANAYEQVFASQDNESGITVHFVDEGMDTGKILVQERFVRKPDDSFVDFQSRGLAVEHKIYPRVLQMIAEGEIATQGVNL